MKRPREKTHVTDCAIFLKACRSSHLVGTAIPLHSFAQTGVGQKDRRAAQLSSTALRLREYGGLRIAARAMRLNTPVAAVFLRCHHAIRV